MNNLGFFLQLGTEKVPPDALQRMELYTREVEVDAHIQSMVNLALLLENGAERAPQDALRALYLYARAIEEAVDVWAMNN